MKNILFSYQLLNLSAISNYPNHIIPFKYRIACRVENTLPVPFNAYHQAIGHFANAGLADRLSAKAGMVIDDYLAEADFIFTP